MAKVEPNKGLPPGASRAADRTGGAAGQSATPGLRPAAGAQRRQRIEHTDGYLEGQILIAMPTMGDQRFARSVIFLCHHTAEGAMGLVVNKRLESLTFDELMKQLEITLPRDGQAPQVLFGGPVESGRGFVLHTDDYALESTLKVGEGIALTATTDILRAIAQGSGPQRTLLALGYAGWGPGQLESEIGDNAWLHTSADTDLVFDRDLDAKWERALAKLGVGPGMLTGAHGHA